MSCQFAIPTGMVAGRNAAAHLLGDSTVAFDLDRYVTCVDLGAAGALFTTGWERTPRKTGADGKDMKRFITEVAIYPPDDPDDFLAATGPGAALAWS